MDTRTEVLTVLNEDLHLLAEQRLAAAAAAEKADSEFAWLTDPKQAFYANLYTSLADITYGRWDEEMQSFTTMCFLYDTKQEPDAKLDALYGMTSRSVSQYFDIADGARIDPRWDDDEQEQARQAYVIRAARKILFQEPTTFDLTPQHMGILTVVALVASMCKPDTAVDASVPLKRAGESADERTYRLAMTLLDDFSHKKLTANQQQGLDLYTRYIQGSSQSRIVSGSWISERDRKYLLPNLHKLAVADPTVISPIMDTTAISAARKAAVSLMQVVGNKAVTQDSMECENAAWARYRKRSVAAPDPTETAEISSMTGFDDFAGSDGDVGITLKKVPAENMLLPSTGSRQGWELSAAAPTGEQHRRTGERMTAIELEGWLGRLGLAWTGAPEATIAEIAIGSSGNNTHYKAVILPEVLADGTVIEHAVARTTHGDDATFVWRAEKGVDDGAAWLTWRDVFGGKQKREAVAWGAKRMLDTPTLELRILEYLTRDMALIDQKAYDL
jgi:hypothetical protein